MGLGDGFSSKAKQWVEDVEKDNFFTAKNWRTHLKDFESFCKYKLDRDIDKTIEDLIAGKLDVYRVLLDFKNHIIDIKVSKQKIGTAVLRDKIKHVRNFLEVHDVPISQFKFKHKVRLPKGVKREKIPPEKTELVDVMDETESIPLKTFCVFCAALGWRPAEILWLSYDDIDESKDPPVVNLLGEKAKIPQDRHLYLSKEAYKWYKVLRTYKHRPRRISRYDRKNHKWFYFHRKPVVRGSDLIFAPYREELHPQTQKYIASLYRNYRDAFGRLLEAKGYKVDKVKKHRKITFYSFRRFVFSTIDGLGYHEFAEYYIGHTESTYWEKPEKEKIAMFRKVEPYLTYLDVKALEARAADIESQLKERDRKIDNIERDIDKKVEEKVLAFLRSNPEALAAMREKKKREKIKTKKKSQKDSE